MPFSDVKICSLINCIALFTICLSLSACRSLDNTKANSSFSKSRQDIRDNDAYLKSFPPVTIDQIAANLNQNVFKVGDTADVIVYGVDSLTNTYVVDNNGEINFPLIGTVRVAGLSTTALQNRLSDLYGTAYLQSPSINVKIESQDLGKIVVDGAVTHPGVFDINNIIILSEAIALAGGINSEESNGSSIFITRNINGERKIREVNIRDIRQLRAEDIQVIPNDVIFVQDSAGRILFTDFIRALPLLNTGLIVARP